MKKMLLLWISIAMVILLQNKVRAQWVQAGPDGGHVTNFAVRGNTIYAATDVGGVLISTNNGINWEHSNFGMTDGSVQSVLATSTEVYAGTYFNGLYKKDISGIFWEQTSLKDQAITCLAAIGDTVFAGTYSTGVWRSDDNGSTWSQVNTGLTSLQIECLAVSGSNIFVGAQDGGVFFSADRGDNWTAANTGLPSKQPISLAVNGTDLYVGLWGSGVYTSPNNGQGWLQFGGNCPTNYVHSFAFDGSDVFIAGQGIYVTSDGGLNWKDISTTQTDGLPWTNIQAICYAGGNLIAGDNATGTSTGMYYSTNKGQSFTHINRDLPNYSVSGIVANSGIILAATSGGVFRSTNAGADWADPTLHGDFRWSDFSAIAFRPNAANYVFAGDINGYVLVSTNGGQDFTGWYQVEDSATVTSFAFINTNVFAATAPYKAGVGGGVYLSSDNGQSWSRVSNGLPTLADNNTSVKSLAVIGSNLFAGTKHGVYLSSDNGTNWMRVNNGLTDTLVTGLAVKGSELFASTSGAGVFRSNDNGTTWTHAFPGKNVTSLAVVDTSVFAGTVTEGIYRLVNSDSSWIAVGLSNMHITSFTSDGGFLYAATSSNTVWKRPISELITGIQELRNTIPSGFSLSQNYPNPFNPTTVISYKLGVTGHITLKIYDTLGREVATLVNEVKPAGDYQIRFNASGLSSGVYFYRLQARGFSDTKKFILLK